MSAEPRLCKKCGAKPASPSHPWCSPCVREAKRTKKAAKTTATDGANDVAKTQYKPLLQDGWPEWAPAYLVALAGFGLRGLAENESGVRQPDVDALRKRDREFVAECRFARRFYYDHVEHSTATHRQIAGPIVALKAHRARRFVEPVIVQQHVTNNNTLALVAEPIAANDMIERLVGRLSPAEVRAMRGEVIDVTPLALPMASHPGDAPSDEEA